MNPFRPKVESQALDETKESKSIRKTTQSLPKEIRVLLGFEESLEMTKESGFMDLLGGVVTTSLAYYLIWPCLL